MNANVVCGVWSQIPDNDNDAQDGPYNTFSSQPRHIYHVLMIFKLMLFKNHHPDPKNQNETF